MGIMFSPQKFIQFGGHFLQVVKVDMAPLFQIPSEIAILFLWSRFWQDFTPIIIIYIVWSVNDVAITVDLPKTPCKEFQDQEKSISSSLLLVDPSPYWSQLDFWKIKFEKSSLKNRVWKIKLDEFDFFFYFELEFCRLHRQ